MVAGRGQGEGEGVEEELQQVLFVSSSDAWQALKKGVEGGPHGLYQRRMSMGRRGRGRGSSS